MRSYGSVAVDSEATNGTATNGTTSGTTNGTAARAWGWPVTQVGMSLALETTSGFCGVELPQARTERVLRRLREVGAEGPVIRSWRPEPWLTFLAEADAIVESDVLHRHHARLMHSGERIPLPPAVTGTGRSTWFLAPAPDRRWLPGLSTIMWALRAA